MSDESISTMQAVTGASADTCQQYLRATNGDIDAAVNLLFAAGADAAAPSASAESVRQPHRPSPTAEQGDDIGFVTPQVASTLADGGGGGGYGGNYAYHPPSGDFVPPFAHMNAPLTDVETQLRIAQQQMARLVGGQTSSAWSAPLPRAVTRQRRMSGVANFDAPEYAFAGSFRDAVREAARAGKWVIVSLVDDDFECGCLNRDVLRNEVVAGFLQSAYVLWQADISSSSGTEVANLYRVAQRGLASVPLHLIINPLTRAELKCVQPQRLRSSASGDMPFDPARMQDVLLEFAESNPPPVVPTVLSESPTDSPIPGSSTSTPVPQGASYHTEDPELAAALALSRQEYDAQQKPSSPTTSDDDVAVVDGPSPVTEAVQEPPGVDLTDAQIEGPEALKLRVRLPSGPWSLSLPRDLPLERFAAGIRTRLAADSGAKLSELLAGMSLLVGFPPKKIYDPATPPTDATTLGETTLRSGDLVTPHVM